MWAYSLMANAATNLQSTHFMPAYLLNVFLDHGQCSHMRICKRVLLCVWRCHASSVDPHCRALITALLKDGDYLSIRVHCTKHLSFDLYASHQMTTRTHFLDGNAALRRHRAQSVGCGVDIILGESRKSSAFSFILDTGKDLHIEHKRLFTSVAYRIPLS